MGNGGMGEWGYDGMEDLPLEPALDHSLLPHHRHYLPSYQTRRLYVPRLIEITLSLHHRGMTSPIHHLVDIVLEERETVRGWLREASEYEPGDVSCVNQLLCEG